MISEFILYNLISASYFRNFYIFTSLRKIVAIVLQNNNSEIYKNDKFCLMNGGQRLSYILLTSYLLTLPSRLTPAPGPPLKSPKRRIRPLKSEEVYGGSLSLPMGQDWIRNRRDKTVPLPYKEKVEVERLAYPR